MKKVLILSILLLVGLGLSRVLPLITNNYSGLSHLIIPEAIICLA